jgi:hypothetical protein
MPHSASRPLTASGAPSAVDVAEWAKDLGVLLRAGTVQQRKALFRLLVKELRVSREEILPTYKIPALVRAPEGQAEVSGLEPPTSAVRRHSGASGQGLHALATRTTTSASRSETGKSGGAPSTTTFVMSDATYSATGRASAVRK